MFEFDAEKSAMNKAKHGIDFVEAQRLWEDLYYIEIPAKRVAENRWMIIACIDGVCWSAIVTYRNDRIRIISVRRARKQEVLLYEGF